MAVRAWLLLANIKPTIIINNIENHNFSYHYHQKNAHLAVVAPGQYYSYERKRTEIYTEVRLHRQIKSGVFVDQIITPCCYYQVGFSYRYQVYHRIAYSLPLPHKEVGQVC